jgi:hypothetical protein
VKVKAGSRKEGVQKIAIRSVMTAITNNDLKNVRKGKIRI